MSFPRFLFRVKDRQIEEEAQSLVAHFGIKDIEIRRDDTIKDAWLEDNVDLIKLYVKDLQLYVAPMDFVAQGDLELDEHKVLDGRNLTSVTTSSVSQHYQQIFSRLKMTSAAS